LCESAGKGKRQQRKVGREEDGSSSNRPELVAFILALRSTPVTNPMLYVCDNQALLKVVKRWVAEGGKAKLVEAPDADILRKAIEELRKRMIDTKIPGSEGDVWRWRWQDLRQQPLF